MRAFSSGAIALSGVEAISNGVPAFRPPETKNAATTLTWTGTILAVLFSGVAALALQLRPTLSESQTILSTMGRAVFGGSSILYFLLQFFTAAILVLSANTAFADFPRLSAVIARDGYMPHQLATRGDRLAFSNGIIALAVVSGGLLVAFNANVSSLVPLFAVGLFASFTLSQSGMVVHHLRLREQRWRTGLAINALGAVATFVVLVVVLASKFTSGAWVPTVVIPALTGVFVVIKRHYDKVTAVLTLRPEDATEIVHHTVVVLIARPTRAAAHAIRYAQAMRPDHLFALTVIDDGRTSRRRARLEAGRPRRPARDHRGPLPRLRRRRRTLPRPDRRPMERRHHHRRHPRVRREPVVGAPPAQPERPRTEGEAALPPQHRRHLSPLAHGGQDEGPRAIRSGWAGGRARLGDLGGQVDDDSPAAPTMTGLALLRPTISGPLDQGSRSSNSSRQARE